jgi:MFS family permease
MKRGAVRESLRVSTWDGMFASCTAGLTSDYIAPYALALGASTSQIGVLTAVPSLAASSLQLASAHLSEKIGSRKKVVLFFVLLHALFGIPILLVPYVSPAGMAVPLLIGLVTLFATCNACASPAWAGLMSEYIPRSMRGKFFGWRSRIMVLVTVGASLVSGMILHFSRQRVLRGFAVIFLLAVVCRVISWYFLTRMYEPAYRVRREAYFSFYDFIRRARGSNFARFVLFSAAFIFCVNLASPFFSVFMLRDLKFNYLTFTLITLTATLAQVVAMSRWGMHADKVGNVKVIRVTSVLIASLPLWWVISQHPLMLFFAQVLSGFAWAGFNLCATNFIYDAVTPQKRVRCIAYYNLFIGLATFAGALTGGMLAAHLPDLFGYRLLSLFVLAGMCRYAVARIFLTRIREVRSAQEISSRDLFYSVIGIRPFLNYAPISRQEPEEE